MMDWLCNLQRSITDAILISLPFKDAVRTSILSRAWKYRWTEMPKIRISWSEFPRSQNEQQSVYDERIRGIVQHVLLLHRGKIDTFHLSVPLVRCILMDTWMLFLSRHGIRKLVLNLSRRAKLPLSLFTCEGVTDLSLRNFTLIHPVSFKVFKNIRSLDLSHITCSDDILEAILSRCTLITDLRLVSIADCTRLSLCSPSLVKLQVVSSELEDILFVETPLITDVSIVLHGSDQNYCPANGNLCPLIEILGRLPMILRMDLLGYALRFFSGGHVPVNLPAATELLYLCLQINFDDMHLMSIALCIFRSSPNLRKLHLYGMLEEKNKERLSIEDLWREQVHFPDLLLALKMLNMAISGTSSELKFIELVLNNAPALQRVQIELEDGDDVNTLRKLNELQRSSRGVAWSIIG